MFSACWNCSQSAIRAQEEVLDPCCKPYPQPSPWLSLLDQSMGGIGWATAHYKVICWLLSFAHGGQSVIIYFCVNKLSELQISLIGELSSAIRLILMRCAGNSHSAETWNWFWSLTRDWIRLSIKKLFSSSYSIQHTCNVRIWFIYLLFSKTIF